MKKYRNALSGTVDRARELRRNSTDAEKLLWRELRQNFPEAKFRRQSPIPPYYADFLSFRHKLVVEVDGGQHDKHRAGDAARTTHIERAGYRVIRFWNHEVLENCDGVLLTIAKTLAVPIA